MVSAEAGAVSMATTTFISHPFFRCAVAGAALLALSACSSGMGAAVQSLRELLPQPTRADATKLDPELEYLRVTRGKHVALLWRGSVERADGAPVDVYYSGQGEVVRLQNGRIVGASGLPTEWRRVEIKAPSWSTVAGSPERARVVRVRDVMPGYVSGLREDLALRRVAAPERSALRGVDAKSLAWFEERVSSAVPAAQQLPTARYAVDLAKGEGTVVYAEQCLAADLCFTWQRWSEAMQQAALQ